MAYRLRVPLWKGFFECDVDNFSDLCYFLFVKGCEEDTPVRKESQRGARLVQGFRSPAGEDTTSEPQGRNAPPGTPVKASMSDGQRP